MRLSIVKPRTAPMVMDEDNAAVRTSSTFSLPNKKHTIGSYSCSQLYAYRNDTKNYFNSPSSELIKHYIEFSITGLYGRRIIKEPEWHDQSHHDAHSQNEQVPRRV